MRERISKDIFSYYQRPKSFRISHIDEAPRRKKKQPPSIYSSQHMMSPIERRALEKAKPGVVIGTKEQENVPIDDYFVSQ